MHGAGKTIDVCQDLTGQEISFASSSYHGLETRNDLPGIGARALDTVSSSTAAAQWGVTKINVPGVWAINHTGTRGTYEALVSPYRHSYGSYEVECSIVTWLAVSTLYVVVISLGFTGQTRADGNRRVDRHEQMGLPLSICKGTTIAGARLLLFY
ncbi:hypothetical protein PsorP6_001609 [Peronosclerospora sorghi]|uniref:Uncharacterized protein n=1 Tax=Peronosclerospora sorghi TaxID=230839 RepID=A0ACC0WT50_9STRA|nr:hypothetical protein PsorP6_001609 [Peronosclerospora sorghi]